MTKSPSPAEETKDMGGYESDATKVTGSGKKHSKKTQQAIPGYTKPTAKHIVFCKAKINIKQNESPTSNMIKVFSSFLTTLLKVDKTLLLYKYKDKTNTSFINRPTSIPTVPSKVKNFFHGRYRPKQDAHQIWPELKIGINMDSESFFEDAKCLLEDKGLGMIFKKDLQAEDTEEIGFFLFSNAYQDKKRQTETLKRLIKEKFKFEPRLNLRSKKAFNPLNKMKGNGAKGSKNTQTEEVKATYVEVVRGDEDKILRCISQLYSSTKNEYPDNEKMRFIPAPKYTQNSGLLKRYGEIINRQGWYMKGISRATSFELTSLDHCASQLKETAREMIMKMTNSTGNPLFTSIDKSWDNGMAITFPTLYETEARNRIADMGSYLHFKYGDVVLYKYFTPDAALRAKDSPWDEEQNRAISKMDKDFENIITDCDQMDWLQAPTETKVVDFNPVATETEIQPQALFQHLPNEDRSLGTFGSIKENGSMASKNDDIITSTSHQSGQKRNANTITPEKKTKEQVKRQKNINDNTEVESLTDDDAETIETLTSKMDGLE